MEEHPPLYGRTIFDDMALTADAIMEGLSSGAFAEARSGFAEQDQALLVCDEDVVLDEAVNRKLGAARVKEAVEQGQFEHPQKPSSDPRPAPASVWPPSKP